jgi:ATP-dependent DNA helicase 2 subunit 2
MSKEATIFIIDGNPTMIQSGNYSKATKIISKMIQGKIFDGRKSDQIGILIVGTKNTRNRVHEQEQGYENVLDVGLDLFGDDQPILIPACLDYVHFLQNPIENMTQGDFMDGIIISIQMLQQHCTSQKTGKPLQFQKKLYFFSDAQSPMDDEFFSDVLEQCDAAQIQVVLCAFDFKSAEEDMETVRGEATLKSFVQRKDPELGIYCDGQEALEMMEMMTTKKTKPTTLFRGPLMLGDVTVHGDDALEIQVWIYAKTNELKLPTSKKCSLVFIGNESFGPVTIEKKFFLQEIVNDTIKEETHELVETIRAYRYGKHMIPFTEEDEQAMKIEMTKGIRILQFSPKQHVYPT